MATRLREQARRQGRSFKDVVNDALRSGLDRSEEAEAPAYRVPVRDMGLRPGIDLDDIQGLLDVLDGAERP